VNSNRRLAIYRQSRIAQILFHTRLNPSIQVYLQPFDAKGQIVIEVNTHNRLGSSWAEQTILVSCHSAMSYVFHSARPVRGIISILRSDLSNQPVAESSKQWLCRICYRRLQAAIDGRLEDTAHLPLCWIASRL
jgi:hypothetical protein